MYTEVLRPLLTTALFQKWSLVGLHRLFNENHTNWRHYLWE